MGNTSDAGRPNQIDENAVSNGLEHNRRGVPMSPAAVHDNRHGLLTAVPVSGLDEQFAAKPCDFEEHLQEDDERHAANAEWAYKYLTAWFSIVGPLFGFQIRVQHSLIREARVYGTRLMGQIGVSE